LNSFNEGEIDLIPLISILGIERVNTLAWDILQEFPIQYIAPNVNQANILLDETIDNYNNEIVHADTDEKKIELIAKTIQAFERIHPFSDANGRTFVNILMNYLLIQEGFPP